MNYEFLRKKSAGWLLACVMVLSVTAANAQEAQKGKKPPVPVKVHKAKPGQPLPPGLTPPSTPPKRQLTPPGAPGGMDPREAFKAQLEDSRKSGLAKSDPTSVEQRTHIERTTRLKRLKKLAEEKGDQKMLASVEALWKKENERYKAWVIKDGPEFEREWVINLDKMIKAREEAEAKKKAEEAAKGEKK